MPEKPTAILVAGCGKNHHNRAEQGSMRMNGNHCISARSQDLASTKVRKLGPRPMFVCTVSLQSSEMQTAVEQEKEAAEAKTLT